MIHISTRTELLNHVAKATNDVGIRDNINHGHVILWGRFVGGWVLETWAQWRENFKSNRVVVGIKIAGTVGQTLISGRLFGVPWQDYIGGDHEIDQGDYPMSALARKHFAQQADTPRQSH